MNGASAAAGLTRTVNVSGAESTKMSTSRPESEKNLSCEACRFYEFCPKRLACAPVQVIDCRSFKSP
jgi:hypothetical protein